MNKRILKLFAFLLVAGMFVYFAVNYGKGQPLANVGDQSTDFELEDLDGKLTSLSDFKGQVVVLNFFTSWCGPCIEEAPELERFEKEYGKDVKLLIIDRGETRDRVKKFIKKYQTTSTYLFDYNHKISKQYNVVGQPETIIIDKKGIIREHYNGPLTKEELYEMVKGHL